jgi:hypothetical protein
VSAMTCPCGATVTDHRAHLGYCSSACLESAVFWAMIRRPLEAMLRDADNPMPCRRCDDDPTSPRTCAACLAEIQMRDDDEAHANECARYDFAQSALADDERDES